MPDKHSNTASLMPIAGGVPQKLRMTSQRVAIVGLNRTGMHLLQQLHSRPDFFVVGVCEANSQLRDAVSHLCDQAVENINDCMKLDWETVVICDASFTATQMLLAQAGRTVVLAGLSAFEADEFQELQAVVEREDSRLGIYRPDHTDIEFVVAKAAVSDGEFGALRTLHRSISSAGVVEPQRNITVDPFIEFAFNDLAQAWDLLIAAGSSPHRMTVQAVPLPGMDGESRGGFLLLLREPSGVVIEIRRSLRSVISEDTGWQIGGTHRGFCKRSEIIRTSEDEIYELTPRKPVVSDLLESLGEPASQETLAAMTALLRCFEALQTSWKHGGTIETFESGIS